MLLVVCTLRFALAECLRCINILHQTELHEVLNKHVLLYGRLLIADMVCRLSPGLWLRSLCCWSAVLAWTWACAVGLCSQKYECIDESCSEFVGCAMDSREPYMCSWPVHECPYESWICTVTFHPPSLPCCGDPSRVPHHASACFIWQQNVVHHASVKWYTVRACDHNVSLSLFPRLCRHCIFWAPQPRHPTYASCLQDHWLQLADIEVVCKVHEEIAELLCAWQQAWVWLRVLCNG